MLRLPIKISRPDPENQGFHLRNKRFEKKRKEAEGNIEILIMERDLMGRILTIALEQKIDLEQVLSYPLTPVPMCFAHMNGAMNKTTKSALFKELEKRNKSLPLRRIDAFVVDGFFLRTLTAHTLTRSNHPCNIWEISASCTN